ncbi:MAG: hypothetical protein GY791_20105, partial [Alphaproteobacteria bacterium]|nr:hypothetical protein [Alphaproteobacteria bacterium]
MQLPGRGAHHAVEIEGGKGIELGFELSRLNGAANGEFLRDGDLWLISNDQGTVVLEDFLSAMQSGEAATITLPNGETISLEEFLGRVVAASEPGGTEPVGPNDDHESASFTTFDPGEIGPGLIAIGPLGNTDLVFGTFIDEDEIAGEREEEEVLPEPNPPIAIDDLYATDEDVTLTVGPAGVLSNDTDTDTGASITVTSFNASSAEGGSVNVAS